jgi:coenzyme F420-reducing hydrogenase beta subunit
MAAINNDEEIRMNSSSGGVFWSLAKEIINKKGRVFGAQFDKNFMVAHRSTNTVDGIDAFQGSKYLQSRIGDTFRECKSYLDNGTVVLFSGTPCQIAGLKAYLQKDYGNLYCVDLICHGVPSPKVWKKYLNYRRSMEGITPDKIVFRSKNMSWKRFGLLFQYSNKRDYLGYYGDDLFYQAFDKCISLRQSCYKCFFRMINKKKDINFNYESDITIGDFWGVDKYYPEMFDDKGTSLVFINTKKGMQIFNIIKNEFHSISVNLELVVGLQHVSIPSNKDLFKRRLFFSFLDILPFDMLVRIFLCKSIILDYSRRVVRKIERTVYKNKY